MRRAFIAGNWKMNMSHLEAMNFLEEMGFEYENKNGCEVAVCPPATALRSVMTVIDDDNLEIKLGAQNMHFEQRGAFTGEISPLMLVSAGCQYVIIGHSERRQYFGETNHSVNLKISAAGHHSLIPIFCIGESEKERESGQTFSVLDKQVKKGLEGLFADNLKTLVMAYEPVWAIGTGKTATSDQAQEVHQFLRSLVGEKFGETLAKSIRILYGGSVKPGNISELMARPDIDGALVGGASLDAETFSKIVQFKIT